MFPTHTGKMKPHRACTLEMSKFLLYEKGVLVPYGSGICRKCLDQYKHDKEDMQVTVNDNACNSSSNNPDEMVTEKKEETGYSFRERKETIKYCSLDSQDSEVNSQELHSQHSSYSQSSETIQREVSGGLVQANATLSSISKDQISPLRSQLRLPWESISERSRRYYKRKAEEAVHHVFEVIAPGQSEKLKQAKFEDKNNTMNTGKDSDLLQSIVKIYENTDCNMLKIQVLGLLTRQYSKSELDKYLPNITKYQYYKAKSLNVESVGIDVIVKKSLPREKMDKAKLQHALSFFMDPAFVQTVSYGTRDLKLDSGETLTIPDVVRTVCHSNIVNLYCSYCTETDFDPLGKSTLYKILNACAASKRTNLQGLDNIASEGNEAFKTLEDEATRLFESSNHSEEQIEEVKSKLSSYKHYLKTEYKLHCNFNDTCADHCITWLLSDPKKMEFKTECDHVHNSKCEKCELFNEITDLLKGSAVSENTLYSIQQATDKIHDWKRHIVRTLNQDQSRLNILQDLQPHQMLLIMDWAMKFLPRKFREKQSDWFGQRGLNWHVSVAIFRSLSGELCHRTYTHILESVKQDWFAVSSVLENTLHTFHQQMPQVKEAFIRSDNAGCYHCAPLWFAIPGISARSGIRIINYCYSESQSGKSYCDAKIAHMRTKMKTYVASGNNILTAEDMKTALDDGKGVVGCQICVSNIDPSLQTIHGHKMKNVSTYNEIVFEENGMRVRKAYAIGQGLFFSTQELDKLAASQCETGLICIKEFSQPSAGEGKVNLKTGSDEDCQIKFVCSESQCFASFSSYMLLEEDILLGTHNNETRQTTYDKVKREWAKFCDNVIVTEKKNVVAENKNQTTEKCVEMGWALKTIKKRPRFSQTVKDFLKVKYQNGENSGKKVTPYAVEKEMKSLKDENGHNVFSVTDCLSAAQIASYFSRLGGISADNFDTCIKADEDLVSILAEMDEKQAYDNIE